MNIIAFANAVKLEIAFQNFLRLSSVHMRFIVVIQMVNRNRKIETGDGSDLSCSAGEPETGNSFHDRLKIILKSERSSKAFAARAGMSQSGFHRIEHGGDPTLPNLLGIAKAAGVSIRWLTGGAPDTAKDFVHHEQVLLQQLDQIRQEMRTLAQTPEELSNFKDAELCTLKLLDLNERHGKLIKANPRLSRIPSFGVENTDHADPAPAPPPLDLPLLEMVIEELERFRAERGLSWSPERRARLIGLGYGMMLEEKESSGGKADAGRLAYLFKAAS
jgi:transcriptional regulator with XRE-family HTH domain